MLHSRRGAALLVLATAFWTAGEAAPQPPFSKAKGKDGLFKADPEVEAWVQMLLPRLTDKNATIRQSAEQALRAVGRPALPALRKVAEDGKGDAVEAARQLAARIVQNSPGGPKGPRGPRQEGGPGIGERAPDFELKFLGAETKFRLSDNFGKRPTVLVFHSIS